MRNSCYPFSITFHHCQGIQTFANRLSQDTAGGVPRCTKLQRVLGRILPLSALVTDVRHLSSNFLQVLTEYSMHSEHLRHPGKITGALRGSFKLPSSGEPI